ncbi:arsenate reductase ArsC [Luminiphilus sp.]|jgi:arsenate reductase|nr:arsenate reductase ArsC [Luminiphilus sp.]
MKGIALMSNPYEILFVCTHNRCRSVLAEVIANTNHDGFFRAHSAGSQPAGAVHPSTLKYLAARGLPTQGLTSQSWNDYSDVQFDLVVTVCDGAAGETCPLWMEGAARVHWGVPDPSRIEGDEAVIRAAFDDVVDALDEKLSSLRHSLT